MVSDIEKAIREYLPGVVHLSLATVNNGMPWICEVHYAYDDNLNLYFVSRPSKRHSVEIMQNGVVAGSIVKQHSAKEKVRGVFFEGKAKKLEHINNKSVAYILFTERFGADDSLLKSGKISDAREFYRISVDSFYLFDSIQSNSGEKYQLTWFSGKVKNKDKA